MENAIILERLAQAREKLGYNRKAFAEITGIPYRTLTNYENGSREPGSGYLVMLSNMCDVSVDWLLGITDVQQKPFSNYSIRAQSLVNYYYQLNPEGQEMLENHARLLANSGEYKKLVSDGILQKKA